MPIKKKKLIKKISRYKQLAKESQKERNEFKKRTGKTTFTGGRGESQVEATKEQLADINKQRKRREAGDINKQRKRREAGDINKQRKRREAGLPSTETEKEINKKTREDPEKKLNELEEELKGKTSRSRVDEIEEESADITNKEKEIKEIEQAVKETVEGEIPQNKTLKIFNALPGFRVEKGKGIFGGDVATLRNLGVAVGYGVAIGTAIIGGMELAGSRLLTSGGLNINKVFNAAKGIFKSTTTITNGGVNTVSANRVIRLLAKQLKGRKYGKAAMYFVGNAVFNGFLEEEADQTLSFAIDKAIKTKDFENAAEMIEFRTEITDESLWAKWRWLIPGTGVFTYLKAARFKLGNQQKEYTKGLIEEQTKTLNLAKTR